MDSIISFTQNNTIIAIILALGLLYFMYRKPKLFFGLLLLGLFLAGLYYMITTMAGSGSAQKKRMIPEEERQVDSNH
jgi:hypothetical protein